MSTKIDLPQDRYFMVQEIYRGWNLAGIVLAAAIIANLALAYVLRTEAVSFMLAVAAAILIAATLVVFFVWTEPANQATQYWTVPPPNWAQLRVQWEYSHAANAVVLIAAFCCSTLAVVLSRQ